jgi:hypothetical protein
MANLTYVIRSVGDLLQVPADRRTDCLRELAECLAHIDELRKQNPNVEVNWLTEFRWIDDGLSNSEHVLT